MHVYHMHVCFYMRMHRCISEDTCMHTRTQMQMKTCARRYMRICMCMCVCVCVCACVCVYVYIYTHTHLHTFISWGHTQVLYIYIYIYIYIYTHTNMYMYVCMYTHVFTHSYPWGHKQVLIGPHDRCNLVHIHIHTRIRMSINMCSQARALQSGTCIPAFYIHTQTCIHMHINRCSQGHTFAPKTGTCVAAEKSAGIPAKNKAPQEKASASSRHSEYDAQCRDMFGQFAEFDGMGSCRWHIRT